jgi:hypothetical protein
MHRESNYLNNVACGEFAKRGFMVLCMNSRFENSESSVKWELIPLDVAEGVNYFKKQLGANGKIILYGHSGGGVTMSFYQAVAENGPLVCQGPNKLVQCGTNLKGARPRRHSFRRAPGKSDPAPAQRQSRNRRRAHRPSRSEARPVCGEERFQCQRRFAIFRIVQESLFRRAIRPHEPVDRYRAAATAEH